MFFHSYTKDDPHLFEGDLTQKQFFFAALSLHEVKSQYLMYNLASNDYRTRDVTTLPLIDPVHQVIFCFAFKNVNARHRPGNTGDISMAV